jgi:hypothetical protein
MPYPTPVRASGILSGSRFPTLHSPRPRLSRPNILHSRGARVFVMCWRGGTASSPRSLCTPCATWRSVPSPHGVYPRQPIPMELSVTVRTCVSSTLTIVGGDIISRTWRSRSPTSTIGTIVLCQAFLTGYTRIQPRPPGYETYIKHFSAARILFMLQWFLGRAHPEPWAWGEAYRQNTVGRLERLLAEATLP